jgi:hypothetical protein
MAHTHALADREDHHAAELAHVHEISLEADSTEASWGRLEAAADQRASAWFVSGHVNSFMFAVAPQKNIVVEPPRTVELLRPVPLLHSHDPPQLRNVTPRAPPVIPA